MQCELQQFMSLNVVSLSYPYGFKFYDQAIQKNKASIAFGEIILVVIGILFALQIDNWNENRTIRKQNSCF